MMTSSLLERLPCSLPADILPEGVDVEGVASEFQDILPSLDHSNLTSDALWRDICALTGSFRTFYGADHIIKTLRLLTSSGNSKCFKFHTGSARAVRLGNANWIEGTFSAKIYEPPFRYYTVTLSLVPGEDGKWKIWVMRTFIDRLLDHPSVDTYNPIHQQGDKTEAQSQQQKNYREFECVVVGGGQAGLSVAGRLQSQRIKYVLLDKYDAVGDSWAKRYNSTKLHTTRESSHLPFDRTFPSTYPQYLTKDQLACGYKDWVEKFDINVWVSTTLVAGRWDNEKKLWTLELLKSSERVTITAIHLIMSIGAGCQIPRMPVYPGIEVYGGDIFHSVDYFKADKWRGKAGIVVGTANTAHDVAEDMVSAGLNPVTMVQRSSTYVLPAEYYSRIQDSELFSRYSFWYTHDLAVSWNAKIPTELADQMMLTSPMAIARLVNMLVLNRMAETEPERFDALEAAGFKVIRYGDIIYQIFERFGGHYMDVGASAKIAQGLIKVKSDALPIHYTKDGLMFSDGKEVKAGFIVFATGFVGGMKDSIREILGPEIADSIDDFWGVNEEGEIKGAFKPTGHSNLWMHGGTCTHARYMSRFLALQIRAALDGTPLKIYSERQDMLNTETPG